MGTWLFAAMYYCENYELIRDVLLGLDENDVVSINICRNLLDSPNMQTELIYISSNYSFLPLLIEGLEKRNLHISESLSMIEKAYTNIGNSQGDIGKAIEAKFISIIKKNINLKTLQGIAKIIDGYDKIVSENVKKYRTMRFSVSSLHLSRLVTWKELSANVRICYGQIDSK